MQINKTCPSPELVAALFTSKSKPINFYLSVVIDCQTVCSVLCYGYLIDINCKTFVMNRIALMFELGFLQNNRQISFQHGLNQSSVTKKLDSFCITCIFILNRKYLLDRNYQMFCKVMMLRQLECKFIRVYCLLFFITVSIDKHNL